MLSPPDLPAAVVADTPAFGAAFARWAAEHRDALSPLLARPVDFEEEVARARALRALLWSSGWGRYGWPEAVGGLGGSSVLRAAIYQELFRLGWSGPVIFEHIEIVAPTLARYADPAFAAEVLPTFLDGSAAWAQGFSEPEAGSDLASLRTRAEETEDGFVVNGSKIWTSWAKWARWCLALVRTGTPDERHRGLTMLAIDLRSPGVDARAIRQANGTDELAEVFFDDVAVPRTQLVGPVGRGWEVAMYLLARERGTLSWLKHGEQRERLLAESARLAPADDRAVGDLVAQWAGLRATAVNLLRRDGAGEALGPEAAYNKLLMTRSEQDLYNLLHDSLGPRIGLPVDSDDDLLRRDYLFSRIVTVYGGSRQMQLMTIAKHVLGMGRA